MSRIAPPSEKIMAVSGVFRALSEELPPGLKMDDPVVQAALIDAATRIAMATDTRDMGIMAAPTPPVDTIKAEYQRFYDFVGESDPAVIDAWHFTENVRVQTEERERREGDHFAYPCDDCGRTDGTHDLDVEH